MDTAALSSSNLLNIFIGEKGHSITDYNILNEVLSQIFLMTLYMKIFLSVTLIIGVARSGITAGVHFRTAMSAIVNAKKMADLVAVEAVKNSDMLFIHDGKGLKKVSAELLKKDLADLISAHKTLLDKVTANGAGAHNSIYRGKNLGTSVTSAQFAAIKAGTFDDLYIGDYWTINGVTYCFCVTLVTATKSQINA